MRPMTVTYLNHSGFSVAIGGWLLIFDYYPADLPADSPGRLDRSALLPYDQVVVFVSHAHADHFDKSIYDWQSLGHVHYILGHDVPSIYEGHRMFPGNSYTAHGVTVEAFDSTDEGVSFLVSVDDYTIFHAGDLNLWHWREQSSLHEIELAEQAFYRAVKPLEGREVDLAFFPVDPRQGMLYDAGGNYFALAVKPRVLIPMHFQGRADVALDFARRIRSRRVEVLALTKPGESTTLEKPDGDADDPLPRAHETLAQAILQDRIEAGARENAAQEGEEETLLWAEEEEEGSDDDQPDPAL